MSFYTHTKASGQNLLLLNSDLTFMGQTQRIELTLGNLRRYALLRKPRNYSKPCALLIMLHGAGGTAAWTLDETELDKFADEKGIVLLLPEGTREDMNRGPGFLQNPQVWNDGSPRAQMGQPGVDDVAFLDLLIDHVLNLKLIDPAKIFMTGFSNGAGMTFRFASEGTHKPSGIAPVSGLMRQDQQPSSLGIPTIYIMGKADPLMPFEGGSIISPWSRLSENRPAVSSTIASWEKALGGVNSTIQTETQNGVQIIDRRCGQLDTSFRTIVVEELGHHWPGGKGTLNKRLAGKPSNKIHASSEIWNFLNG